MNTTDFVTKNGMYRLMDSDKPRGKFANKHIIGLDLGYSAPKGYHENGEFIFPNYCKKLAGELQGELSNDDMIYTDIETGDKYVVGSMALKSMTSDTVVAEDALYGRNHYLSKDFKVMFETSLGLACWDLTTTGEDLFLQTGLPPAYLETDSPYLRSVLEGEHNFTLRVGKDSKSFSITLLANQIDIMPQPMGTLNSLLFNNAGNPTRADLLKSDVLIVDAGFGTLDTFFIHANQIEGKNTDSSLGMKRILTETRDLIRSELGINVSIPAMQKVLKTGEVEKIDLISFTTKKYKIDEYLKRAVKKVEDETFDFIKQYAFNVEYIILTGGTTETYRQDFIEKLTGIGKKVLMGNENCSHLPVVFANSRGYYYSRLYKFKLGLN